MVEPAQKAGKSENNVVSEKVKAFLGSLSEEERMLVVLKAQLYADSWEPMLEDLKNRLSGKPYIFKLANRIQDDIKRIEQMAEFETENNIDLADYVEMP